MVPSADQIKKIDVPHESIELVSVSSVEAEELSQAISDSEPRYSFFRFSHDYEGQRQAPIIFVYTCPSGSKIKERMLYASSRAGVITTANEANIEVGKKVSLFIQSSSVMLSTHRLRLQCPQKSRRKAYMKSCIPK